MLVIVMYFGTRNDVYGFKTLGEMTIYQGVETLLLEMLRM